MKVKEKKQFVESITTYTHSSVKEQIKTTLGDSTNNHRTVTVNQLIRFLTRKGATPKQKVLGSQLRQVFTDHKEVIRFSRTWFTNRTDAYDINELLSAVTA